MGYTVIEKILAQHSTEKIRPGQIIWIDLDIRSARDFGGPNVVRHYRREYGNVKVSDKSKTFFTFDLCVPASSLRYADNQQICRDFAGKQGIRVFDVDQGIGSHIMIEKGLAFSGSTVVGTDSHLNILGAVGSFGQGMGDIDIAFAFKTGKTWFEVPETIKVNLEGRISPLASPKDLTLFVLKELGTKTGALKAIEFYGEAVRSLSLSGRITLCSMVTEMAGIIGFIPEINDSFVSEIKDLTGKKFSPVVADKEAEYSFVKTINVNDLQPQIAAPFLPTNVSDVKKIRGEKLDSGFIGSCTNGRLEDFAQAAQVLKGRKVKQDIMLKMVPATRLVYQEILEKGILEDLHRSGVIISNPGCGGCAEGHIGLTGEGEVQISTGNRNFEGKQGKGKIFLASPAVVASSCVAGFITLPEDL